MVAHSNGQAVSKVTITSTSTGIFDGTISIHEDSHTFPGISLIEREQWYVMGRPGPFILRVSPFLPESQNVTYALVGIIV